MTFPRFIDPRTLTPEPDEVLQKKVAALLDAMTEEELLDLCHGHANPEGSQVANAGYHPGVPRLGVPEIRMYDGPAGVTSIYETTGLPVQEMLAAAWDRDLAYRYGAVEGSENVAISGTPDVFGRFIEGAGPRRRPGRSGDKGHPGRGSCGDAEALRCGLHRHGYAGRSGPAGPGADPA